MSTQIDTALVNAYRSNIEVQFQQMGSRLRKAVRVESQNAEYEYYDRIGPTTAVEITSRHSDTVLVETPHSRRRVGLRDYDWADLVDRPDKLRMLADPTSSYSINAAAALGRAMDDAIIAAATGTAYTGKTGTGTVSTGWNTVAHGSAGLTVAKLIAAKQLLYEDEAVEPGEDLFLVCTAEQISDLLGATSGPLAASYDFNNIRALVAGEIDYFCGFNFIRSERLTKVSTERSVLAFARNALCLAVADEIKVRVEERSDKRFSTQVYVSASFGATRMWEEKLCVVECTEDA